MDVTQLRYFRAVVEEGSLKAAAVTLGVTQPTVTVAIQNLEQELGTRLMKRDRSGVTLTAQGTRLSYYANVLVETIEKAAADIRGLEVESQGTFRLGCQDSLALYFLPRFLPYMTHRYPSIQPTVSVSSGRDVRQGVIDRQLDFGLLTNTVQHQELVVVKLFSDVVELVHQAEGEPAVNSGRASDLRAAEERVKRGPLIYAGTSGSGHSLVSKLTAMDLLPAHEVVCHDLELVSRLIQTNHGIGLLPRRALQDIQNGTIRALHSDLPVEQENVQLIYRGDSHRTTAWSQFKDETVRHSHLLSS